MKRIAIASAVALALAACAAETEPQATPTPSTPTPTEPSAPPPQEVDVYYQVTFDGRAYLAHEIHEIVPSHPDGLVERVVAVVDGEPQDPDHFTGFNEDAEVRSVSTADGVATVDFNAAVLDNDVDERTAVLAVQQLIWTLHAVPEVADVRFTVEGETHGEASNGRPIEEWWGHFGLNEGAAFAYLDDVLEPITILEPAEGDEVSGKTLIRGTATVFEANVVLRILGPDREVVDVVNATADEGAPGRGDWQRRYTFPDSAEGETWTIEAVEESAEDGGDVFVQTRQVTVA